MIAMSGGVDSTVAAYLIGQDFEKTAGATMRLFYNADLKLPEDAPQRTDEDIADAKAAAEKLGISHYTMDLREDFKNEVLSRFVRAYMRGLTPNPCIDCNRYIKFLSFLKASNRLGFEKIATGHYAQIEKIGDRCILKKAADLSKDQSYVLWSLTQAQLASVLLPLGSLSKPEVREIAEQNGFVNAKKRDSQDICFVPNGDYFAFIERYTGKAFPEGDFTDLEGNVLGRHKGIIRYTIGQRRGLGLALPQSMYVCEKDAENNRVLLGLNPDLMRRTVKLTDCNLIACDRFDTSERLSARIRYSQKEQPATVTQTGENTLQIVFDEPQRAVTPGQSAVLYDGDTVVGGGIIV